MAKVNFERRADSGRDERTRTRAQLISAAKVFYSQRSWESVTIDEVAKEAGVEKDAFSSNFKDLDELLAAVADEVAKAVEEMRRQAAGRRARDQRPSPTSRSLEYPERDVSF